MRRWFTSPAVFAVLTLAPAAVLAWLGWSSTAALVDELRRTARDEALRVCRDVASALPAAVAGEQERAEAALSRVAEEFAADLPFVPPGQLLARGEQVLGDGALLVVAQDGRVLVPRGPSPLVGELLPEWRAYCAALAAPAGEARLQKAKALRTPVLRCRAMALVAEGDAAAFAAQSDRFDAATLVAAGPAVVERLRVCPEGCARLRSLHEQGWLAAVPATPAAHAEWLAAIDAPAAARESALLRRDAEAGAATVSRSAELPGEARLVWHRTPAVVVAALRPTLATEVCEVAFAAATQPAEPSWDGDVAVHAVATALGPIAVRARHTGLDAVEAAAGNRRWFTGLGIALLLLTIGSGLALARRALFHERAAARLRDDFLANVSHELKTPLTSLRMHAEMLGAEDLNAATRRRYAAVAAAEGERLTALVDDLLDFAALQRGQRRLEPEPVDLAAAGRSLAASWEPLCRRAGVALAVVGPDAVPVLADPRALARIVANLLQNALRHGRPTRDGGDRRIDVVVGPGPRLEVRDNGPGVPAALREQVFERFERVRRDGVGIGLGLALSRGLAEAMGGRLICGDDGAWTVFALELPGLPELGFDGCDGREATA